MSESSSEDENSARLKEAVWSFTPQDVKTNGKDGDDNKQSRRANVSKHEHDGNELGTTPEFRSHVAKKLGVFLDGCISVCSETVKPGQAENRDEEEDEEGFRLFSTSAPGKWMEESPPPPSKRRPVPSSSDSDSEMEMRLREAAVSAADILGSSAPQHTGKTETRVESETGEKKKKKKKKKRETSTEEREEKISQAPEKHSKEQQTTVEENLTKKKKKKKRKKLEEGAEDDDDEE